MSRLISRDPFARQELHSFRVYVNAIGSCKWCGSTRATKTGRRYLNGYYIENDAGRRDDHLGLFCSKSCHDDYHG
ncbi:hypothetical protein [Bradyrhizobium sp. Tv2a-2]|uniref:hypothetical protein n=1 Tax=Bradyrhizobium sp. Tv2a-2 TaxID=113395 RepID=UPI00041110AF|nr:hypothetical protein [Bradyrhizobium sp. Tv2a-2]